MPNGMMSQEKFDGLESTQAKLGIVYECLLRLEKRKWLHNGFAATGGIVGGVFAMMGKWFFFK